MKVQVEFEQTVSRTAVIEVDEAEYDEWRGDTTEDLRSFLQADLNQARLEEHLARLAEDQSTPTRFEEFRILSAKEN